jgi:phosphonate transport system substrate-binding protein
MYRKFSPILEAITVPLENQLNRKVDIHLTIFKDYESGIDALAHGEVDFVRFGPSSYILAEIKNPNIRLLAMELRKGLKSFNGVIIAKIDSGIHSVNDLKGKNFAFGDKYSTIGRYLAQSILVDNDVNENDLASFEFLGRHDLVAKAVITGTHDAGALKASTFKKLCDPEEIAIIKTFANVTKPWVARGELPEDIRSAITASLLQLENSEIIGELGCSGFIEASPKDYENVRQSMKNAKLFYPKKPEELQEEID